MSIHDLDFITQRLNELKEQGVYRKLAVLEGPSGARSVINGKEVINLSSNNYLGLANHPRLKKAAMEALEKWGVGAGAVRTIIGNMSIHEELEAKLAEFKHVEAVLVFQSGFTANAGVIPAVVDKGDIIISDELNHASIIDGCRLSRADVVRYKHSDMEDLERVINEVKDNYNTKLIITDGVFSMDGDVAKLPEIVDLAEKYGCLTYVDDAHASGVLGKSGRGSADHFGLHGRVDIQIGTLSKAIGVVGGYVAGRKNLIEWLNHRGRPFLFSTAAPPSVAAACLEAINILSESTELTDRLWENARYLKKGLKDLGFNTGNSETPITPVIAGDDKLAIELSKKLFEEGVFAQSIVFPTVPRGGARVRTIVTAAHTKADLDETIRAFEKVGKELKLIK
ncbi:glycine C-acetyltransferase [Lutispora saccharofermentans]|uniref:8-amino-7-ketopelargonate synthase n=1 Tax=Lutispora saccharofermentans TaxID=3024236 RepID=A0ABT1NAW8_9FIRM|nr:glycine C-acetyltransferase [Lutispora saccharofermentans]MCQ1528395.1 glycine C-acetyltransferase [Lutispora saccharofermentans]